MTTSRFGFGVFLSLFFILLNLTVCAPLNSAFDSEKDLKPELGSGLPGRWRLREQSNKKRNAGWRPSHGGNGGVGKFFFNNAIFLFLQSSRNLSAQQLPISGKS